MQIDHTSANVRVIVSIKDRKHFFLNLVALLCGATIDRYGYLFSREEMSTHFCFLYKAWCKAPLTVYVYRFYVF